MTIPSLLRVVAAAALAALPLAPLPACAAEVTLRLATWGSPQHPQVTAWVPLFTSEVEKNSKGRIAVQSFPAASLVKETDVASAVPAGVADISLTVIDDFSGIDPAIAVFGSPLMQFSFEGFFKAMHPGTELFEAANNELKGHGAILLSAIDIGPPVFVSKDPLKVPGDFKGKNIRVFSANSAATVQLLGGAPTQLSQNDVYAALSTGTVQGAYGGLPGIYGAKQYEVTKYLADPGPMFGLLINGYVMNAKKFASLPPDLQKVVLDAANKANQSANDANRENYEHFLREIAAHGNEIVRMDPKAFSAQAKALTEAARAKYGTSSPLMKALAKVKG